MSTVTVADVREWLRLPVGHANLLQKLIDQAEEELVVFLNRTEAPTFPPVLEPCCSSDDVSSSSDAPGSSSEDPAAVARAFQKAVCILVQAAFEQTDPDKFAKMRTNAENVVFPYRRCLGV